MAAPDSTTQALVFLEEQPDWKKPVTPTTVYTSTVWKSRGQGEQRARWRERPRYSIAYFLTGLGLAGFSARRIKALSEVGSPVVCPIWTDKHLVTNGSAADAPVLDADLSTRKFKPGSYAYFVEPGGATYFRAIVSISGTVLTLATGHAAAPNGTACYPCIVGERKDGKASFTLNQLDASDEAVEVTEL